MELNNCNPVSGNRKAAILNTFVSSTVNVPKINNNIKVKTVNGDIKMKDAVKEIKKGVDIEKVNT